MSVQYHEVFPENIVAGGYKEFDNVDFVMTYEGRKLQLNSIRILCDITVTPSGGNLTNVVSNPQLYFDGKVGGHGVIDSIISSVNGAVIENSTSYGRLVSMKTKATTRPSDMNVASNSCEGKVSNDRLTNLLLRGVPSGKFTTDATPANHNYLTSIVDPFNVAIKPDFCLNNAFSDSGGLPLISFRKSGTIKVSLRLARNFAFLYGEDATGSSYTLTNLRMTYMSRDDDGTDDTISMRSVVGIRQGLASDYANIQAVVPAVCNAVSMSVQPQDYENTARQNNYQLHTVPQFTSVQYLFNDSTNKYLTFLLRTEPESLERYIDSFRDTGMNSADLVSLRANLSYGLGLSWGSYISLMNQKFNIQLQSGIGSSVKPDGTARTWIAYMFFHTLISL